ncbi:hypothetical protein NDU88_001625 [Pleurodeles waltl]|uniref:Uncharacterized protein n=1 Tax=Pleurodeles waltl TaxID=8319 RepID=A0AAV7R7N3_PLEWA|nr:hypothetical protein NDU88_001625 [Pleurodeles waltl]
MSDTGVHVTWLTSPRPPAGTGCEFRPGRSSCPAGAPSSCSTRARVPGPGRGGTSVHTRPGPALRPLKSPAGRQTRPGVAGPSGLHLWDPLGGLPGPPPHFCSSSVCLQTLLGVDTSSDVALFTFATLAPKTVFK